jgi:hypothetical protein
MFRSVGAGVMLSGAGLPLGLADAQSTPPPPARRTLGEQPLTPQSIDDRAGTGGDDSATMLAFFNACIAGRAGHIPAGNYRVAVGTLLFDNANVRKAWPNITTAGPELVTFTGTGTGNSPIIEFRNGTYTGGESDAFWIGGCLGGITFELASATAGTNRHGIKAYGMYGTRFGHMIGKSLGGSTIHLTEKKYRVTNPDPYCMAYCVFDVIEGYRNTGRTLDNRNFAGFSFCSVNAIRGIENAGGVLYGLGASNTFFYMSAGLCRGWAINSGAEAEGLVDRSLIVFAEIDTCEYGINLEKVGNVDVQKIRFIHRYEYPPNVGSDDYWPRICINLADNSGGVADANIEVIHRIERGGDKADLGVFVDGNNSGNIGNVIIDQRIYPTTTGFTFTDSEYHSAINANAYVRLLRDGIVIYDSIPTLAGIGYRGLGAAVGGTVTQATSRTTGVALDKPCGQITLFSAAGSASWRSFTVTNSYVAAGDTIHVVQKSGTDKNMVFVTAVATGSFEISFATTGGTTTEQPVFTFAVIKAVAA